MADALPFVRKCGCIGESKPIFCFFLLQPDVNKDQNNNINVEGSDCFPKYPVNDTENAPFGKSCPFPVFEPMPGMRARKPRILVAVMQP